MRVNFDNSFGKRYFWGVKRNSKIRSESGTAEGVGGTSPGLFGVNKGAKLFMNLLNTSFIIVAFDIFLPLFNQSLKINTPSMF